jgi:hypothetical protein
MSADQPTITHAHFERLIARASELDDRATARMTIAQGSAIARELGISQAAWDAAVRELAEPHPSVGPPVERVDARWRLFLVALVGGVAAGLWGAAVNGGLRGWDLPFGAALIAVSLALVTRGLRRRSATARHLELVAWWLAIPVGLTVGAREYSTDVGWFAFLSWSGTALVGAAAPGLLRRLRWLRARLTPDTA